VEQQHANRQIVVTRIGNTLYGIDIDDVHEIIPVPQITPVPKSPANMLGVINVRSVVIPVADLRACLGFAPGPFTTDTRIVLVSYHDEKIGLVVDAVTEVTTLSGGDFQSMENSHGESAFLQAVARFQGQLVLEIDHTRAVEDGLNRPVAPSIAGSSTADAEVIAQAEAAALHAAALHAAVPAAAEDDGPLHVELLEMSFELLAPQADKLAERFYERLFEAAPAVQPLFKNDMARQRRALTGALGTIVNHLRQPEMLSAYVSGLGARHAGYGAQPEHYAVVTAVLLDTMAEIAGDRWSDGYTAAWARALSAVSKLMLEGAAERTVAAAA
jgi:chemotaxis signal transduction protein/hemoglobin-like flavoprotein